MIGQTLNVERSPAHPEPEAFSNQTVYFDANVFIYALVAHPLWGVHCGAWLQASASKQLAGITGHLTLAACLAKPLRENNAWATDAVRGLLAQVCHQPSPTPIKSTA